MKTEANKGETLNDEVQMYMRRKLKCNKKIELTNDIIKYHIKWHIEKVAYSSYISQAMITNDTNNFYFM